ncbi:hypothetical protein, partial [Eikenella glucosivorans]|uniref:hypothetical protein n=1 Tax=Eikenella glucosivorans TaxID=2766967 RepID=UPI0019660473
MGLLKFYSVTIRPLYSVLRLGRVRLGLFSRALVILSTLILTIPLAYPQSINIQNGRAYVPVSEIRANGVQTIRYLDGGFDQIYYGSRDLSRIRSAVTGAEATARLPVVATRTVPRAAVVSKVFTNARAVGLG